ncbi:hypothetical protein FR275_00280 [Vibrio cholerae]|uniref:hypothetical protein n=1 Tax=Vibrio cholerae TaxID=666 RepID=UPI00089312B2|nr:hypothetical protein [Vibrio cholerae]EGR0073150.1 hypothetical protein [Vibrio cholerae]EJL6959287.1 hypothetical protein [Vibrio cholerae]OFJ32674.1 hypothetical protein BFX34_08720 [Vibrio cholerae]
MKVVPMIFNTDMVKALMAGDKRVTRRPVKIDYERGMNGPVVRGRNGEVSVLSFAPIAGLCPFGNFGDLIYVRETFRLFNHSDECGCSDYCACPPSGTPVYFATCGDDSESKWKPSIHMPRTASRLTLKVTDVRIERVQDITEDECWKEGVEHIDGQFDINQLSEMAKTFDGTFEDAKASFACLWDSIYQNWNQNPYVWVIEFEVIHQNVDKYLESVKERP